MKEVQDQLEVEQYFSKLYKTQYNELRDEMKDRMRQLQKLDDERSNIMHQLQLANARADTEALARSIAEETVADLEKEKTMKELELKDLLTKHRNELMAKEALVTSLKDAEAELKKSLGNKEYELEDVLQQSKKQQEELYRLKYELGELDKCRAKLVNETILKQQAVNKLAEIMNRKDNNLTGKQKMKVNSTAELRKKEKESKRLQQELSVERAKYDEMCQKHNETVSLLARQIDVSGGTVAHSPYFLPRSVTFFLHFYFYFNAGQHQAPDGDRLQGDGNRTPADEVNRDGLAVLGRQRHDGGKPGLHLRGLAERAEQAEHQAARLEAPVRGRVSEAHHLLQLGAGQAKHERSTAHHRFKVRTH